MYIEASQQGMALELCCSSASLRKHRCISPSPFQTTLPGPAAWGCAAKGSGSELSGLSSRYYCAAHHERAQAAGKWRGPGPGRGGPVAVHGALSAGTGMDYALSSTHHSQCCFPVSPPRGDAASHVTGSLRSWDRCRWYKGNSHF